MIMMMSRRKRVRGGENITIKQRKRVTVREQNIDKGKEVATVRGRRNGKKREERKEGLASSDVRKGSVEVK